mgnify:CR=1 FL=1
MWRLVLGRRLAVVADSLGAGAGCLVEGRVWRWQGLDVVELAGGQVQVVPCRVRRRLPAGVGLLGADEEAAAYSMT